MPTNKAAWLMENKFYPLQVKEAPYTPPGPNQMVIKNGAVAVNPLDWILQKNGNDMLFKWIKYPWILGTDVAGEVVEIGSAVTRFKVGDRVVATANGSDEKRNTASESGFQLYTVVLDYMASPIPNNISYESASVLPLGTCTAACGLFQDDQLGLQLPSRSSKPTGKTLLVWGGSTSVGSSAIQLAIAAGYEVFTTASPSNFDYAKGLGAARTFDYKSKTIINDIIQAFKGKRAAGAIAIGHGSANACMDVLNGCQGNKFVAMVSFPAPSKPPQRFISLIMMYTFITWSISTWIKCKLRGINYKFVFGGTLLYNKVGRAIFEDFLGDALAKGTFRPAPEPVIAGKGLESLQAAMDLQRQGVSAKKVVVSL